MNHTQARREISHSQWLAKQETEAVWRWGLGRSDRLALLLLLAFMAGLCALNWERWGSVIIDCGREMYVPAELSLGKRLYFDLVYPYGPLIPYWHSLLFRVFGVHLSLLYVSGLGTAFALAFLLYKTARMFLPVSLSLFAGFAFALTALPQNLFNYALPYSYPAAYGTLLYVAICYLLLTDCGHANSTWRLPVAGLLAACALLTKIEVGLAAYGLLCCAVVVRALSGKRFGSLARGSLMCLPPLLLAASVYAWLVSASSLHFIFGDNIPLLPDSYFVQHYGKIWAALQGFTTAPRTLMFSAAIGFGWVGLVTLGVIASTRWRSARWVSLCVVGIVCGLRAWAYFDQYLAIGPPLLGERWQDAVDKVTRLVFFNPGMAWPSLLLLIVAAAEWRRAGRHPSRSAALLLAAASFGYAVRTLTRIGPWGYPIFYGVLTYVGALTLVATLCRGLQFRVPPRIWNALAAELAAGVLVMMSVAYVPMRRPSPITSRRGTIYTDAADASRLKEALQFIDSAKQRNENVLVLPEETTLYFFSETSAPSSWYVATPGIIPDEAMASYLSGMDRQRVRYLILSNRRAPEYGTPIFGQDYNQKIYAWIQRNYRPVRAIGHYERVAEPKRWAAMVYERVTQ